MSRKSRSDASRNLIEAFARARGALPLPWGEGWGEGVRSLKKEEPPHPAQSSRRARLHAPTSPEWGEGRKSAAGADDWKAARGFTLIEALVALAVVAAVLGSIGSAIATTVRGTRAIDDRLALAGTAEALLTALPSRETLRIGRQTGRTGGFVWRIDVTPMPMRQGELSRWRPVAVDIRMQKPDGGAIQMKTVRLIPQGAP